MDFKKIATGEKIKIKNMISKSETRVEDTYKILNQLGKGSFGSVFKVLHIESGLIRAMKVIKKESLCYQDDDQTFLKEIEILIGTEHPNIIKIYEYYCDDTNYYIITEFLSGGELYDTICDWDYFDEEKAGYILIQILSAVNYLHSLKIVHRDIKPENMLVENKLKSDKNDELINIKLIDFGTCNYYDVSKSLTLKVGSPYYIAPEVLKRKYNEKCDIWSCGVILFIMLVGYPPFSGSTTTELLENVAKGKFSMKNSCWNNVSEQVKDLLKKMLEFEPTKRISAQEAIEHPWIIKIKQKQIINIDKNYFSSVLKNIKNFNAKEKLQQATIAYIVHFIYSSQEIEGLKKVFKYLDKNGDGRLTYGELRSGFDRVFGRYLSDLEMNKVIEEVDGDNDGYISYEEFLRVSINRKKLLEERNLKLAFDRFDLNRDGKLSREELKNVLGTQENQYINLLLLHIDKNNDGFISFSEFCNLMNGVVNSTINPIKDNEETNLIYVKLNYTEKNTQKSTNIMTILEENANKNTYNNSSNNYNQKNNNSNNNEFQGINNQVNLINENKSESKKNLYNIDEKYTLKENFKQISDDENKNNENILKKGNEKQNKMKEKKDFDKNLNEKEIILNDDISDLENKIDKNNYYEENKLKKSGTNTFSHINKTKDKNLKSTEIRRHNDIFDNHHSSSESSNAG